ncbi:MAG: DEAD/DEAH box helicase [Gemmatimonadetes bacterium]|nr:DEAD/DEAH box helicase [Gemmatimonadota bacterium]
MTAPGPIRQVRDQYLPPDPGAFHASAPSTGRVIVIAPTRAACETIELAVHLELETYLLAHHKDELMAAAASGEGFGIVAGTGTGKTLAVRPIAQTILGTPELKVGVVNREREATPETPSWNVVIVTTGIARRWFQDGDITSRDTLVVDEIHQTSAELELCLALGKRAGCRYIWLSATVDPAFYARYLGSKRVLQVSAFDESKAALVKVVRKDPLEFLDDRFMDQVVKERRGVGIFMPTRAGVEQVAAWVADRYPRVTSAHYHGGEPIRVIRPFLEGEGAPRPFFLAMTAAGQSALNVRGLDTVIIDDTRFTNVVERGKNVLTRVNLGANEILQMAGRVHGRVAGGRVFILSDRDLHFQSLRATAPEFQLAGDSERVALTCAAMGVRADELDLPVPLDRTSYRDAMARLEARGLVEAGRLTRYGREVEKLPVERPWAELIVHADDALVPYLAVMASVESLHRMTREERDLEGLIVPGSDHLTAYNVYAEAFTRCGYVGEVYGLPRHQFDESVEHWAERRGVLVKALEDTALAMASVYRAVGLPLPTTMARAGEPVRQRFGALLAQFMPFDLVIDERTATGDEARVSRTSVCGSWGAVAGSLRYFADRFGVARAAIEGTQLAPDLVRRHATGRPARLMYEARHKEHPLVLVRRLDYFGFELERESEPLTEPWPDEHAAEARRLVADALARGEARHAAVKRNQPVIDEIRMCWRRSGGTTPPLTQHDLAAWYAAQLGDARAISDVRAASLRLERSAFVDDATVAALAALPGAAEVRGKAAPIDYDVEDVDGVRTAVAKLRLHERQARGLVAEELPALDRPLRFVVLRGARGAVRARTLEELHDVLDRPWTDEELEAARAQAEAHKDAKRRAFEAERNEREANRHKRALGQHRDGDRGRPGGGPHGKRDDRGGPGGIGRKKGKFGKRRGR